MKLYTLGLRIIRVYGSAKTSCSTNPGYTKLGFSDFLLVFTNDFLLDRINLNMLIVWMGKCVTGRHVNLKLVKI